MCEVAVVERWRPASRAKPPSAGVVHVWRVDALADDDAVEAALTLLTPAERARFDRVSAQRPRTRFCLTRAALRSALSLYLDVAASEIGIVESPRGKPSALIDGRPSPIVFSVTHTEDVALLAFARDCAVGIDVERVRDRDRSDAIARRLFPAHVLHTLANVQPEQRLAAFYHAWTQREAVVKAVGGGLFDTDDPLDLTWPCVAGIEVQRVHGAAEWSIARFAPAPGYVASVVATGVIQRIEFWLR